jgi:serine/threonine protein kinase/Tol biopolymer transport system component
MVSATHHPGLGDIGPFANAIAGQYRIERELGSGGTATVYLATDLKHERRVAIKVLHPELGAWLGADRFLTEIRIMARLQHPHILPLLDSGEATFELPERGEGRSLLYYVMPYVEGETLRARLRREQQLPVSEAVRIAKELVAALSYAHARGVIHRDIKPENVLLAMPHAGSPAPALLADFGIARALESSAERLTGTGVTVGTAGYMSPEQATGEREVDGRSDVYALGCVLYEMLAGEPPFTGPNPRAILAKSLADPVRPVGRIRDGIPTYVETALATALGRVPADRFPDMSAFGAALDAPASVGRDHAATGAETREVTRGSTDSRLVAGKHRLDSWKEVAAYLGRGVRTVQRWERDEGLPVHRLAHEKRGSIYAYSDEVDAWWRSRRVTLSAERSDEDVAVTRTTPTAPTTPRPDRLTWISAATFWPALSSDGRLLAYVSDGGRDGAVPQIWLQQIGGSAVCLTSGVRERSFLSFSADDTRLVFTATDDAGPNVYTMPTLGGEPKLLKRAARAGRPSPDGKWLAYLALDDAAGVRIAGLDGTTERTIAPGLIDVSFAIWSPDTKHVLVQAHADPAIETDYWIISIDGSVVEDTGILQRLRAQGLMPLTLPAAWVSDSLVFTVITPRGVTLWRQRLAPSTLRATGDPDHLTRGTEYDTFVTGASGRIAFVSTHPDQNLWSVAIDPVSGMARGALRRLTRGPGFVAQLSVSQDPPTLAYFCARPAIAGLKLRNLASGAETDFSPEPPLDYGFPALSPSGRQLAYGARSQGARAMRPIFIATLPDGPARKLADDCGGRPRQWIDERLVVVERFGARLHSVALLDTVSGDQRDVLSSPEQSITNARVSPDGEWIAFDAARPGGPPTVFVARLRPQEAVPQDDWRVIDRSASHPFWSADGSILYDLPTTPSRDLRNVVRAHRFDASVGGSLGEPFTAFTSAEMVVPANITAIAPVATRDEIILVLGDFRGDVWMMDL